MAAAAGALLLTSPAGGGSAREALTAALLAIGGGLTQAVLVAAWPRQRWKEQRRAMSGAYAWLAAGYNVGKEKYRLKNLMVLSENGSRMTTITLREG